MREAKGQNEKSRDAWHYWAFHRPSPNPSNLTLQWNSNTTKPNKKTRIRSVNKKETQKEMENEEYIGIRVRQGLKIFRRNIINGGICRRRKWSLILIVPLLDWNHNFGLLLRPFWCNWKSIIDGSESHGHGESERRICREGRWRGWNLKLKGEGVRVMIF